MRKKIKFVVAHPLIAGSATIFMGSMLANVLNFAFNLFMSRNLTVSDYGILASLSSFIGLATLPAGAIVPTVVHFASSYIAQNEEEKIKSLFWEMGKYVFSVAAVLFIILVISSGAIAKFFHIDNVVLILVANVVVLLAFIGSISTGILQAKLAFRFISFMNVMGTLTKVVVGSVLVLVGIGVFGAIIGFSLSYVIAFLFSFIPIIPILRKKSKKIHISMRGVFSYGWPAALSLFGITAFTSTDVMLVKHFFPSTEAGLYAGLSLIGKVIFFFSAPIGLVMFPLVVQRSVRRESHYKLFFLSLLLVVVPSLILSTLYFIAPEFIIKFFLKKDEYLQIAPLLGLFGIYTTLFSITTILVQYYLSIKKTNVYIPVCIGSIIQVILIWFFHSSFLQVIIISMSITAILLSTLLLYYFILYGKSKVR